MNLQQKLNQERDQALRLQASREADYMARITKETWTQFKHDFLMDIPITAVNGNTVEVDGLKFSFGDEGDWAAVAACEHCGKQIQSPFVDPKNSHFFVRLSEFIMDPYHRDCPALADDPEETEPEPAERMAFALESIATLLKQLVDGLMAEDPENESIPAHMLE